MIDKIFATIVFATIGLILIVKLRRFILDRSGSAKNIWNFLGNQSGVESSIIDSNPRVAYALQPAFEAR